MYSVDQAVFKLFLFTKLLVKFQIFANSIDKFLNCDLQPLFKLPDTISLKNMSCTILASS